MRTLCALTALLALSSFTIGCKSDGEEEDIPEIDCPKATVPAFADVAAFGKCKMCHDSAKMGADRKLAPTTINFDTEAGAEANKMKAAAEVAEGAMPPADSKITLTEDEKTQLYTWVQCAN